MGDLVTAPRGHIGWLRLSSAMPPPDDGQARSALSTRSLLVYLCLLAPPLGWIAVAQYQRARAADSRGDHYQARILMHSVRTWCWYTLSMIVCVLTLLFFVALLTANGHAVLQTFFNGRVLAQSFPDVLAGFWINVQMFLIAEVLVLPWAFFIAALRMMPGKPGRPIRALAMLYVDIFRGMPAVIVIYLIAFGFPIANLPIVGQMSSFALCTVALVLVYGAYVSEVFRAGIQGVHWS